MVAYLAVSALWHLIQRWMRKIAHSFCMHGPALIMRECHSSGNPVVVQKKDTVSLGSYRDIAMCLWYIPTRSAGPVESSFLRQP